MSENPQGVLCSRTGDSSVSLVLDSAVTARLDKDGVAFPGIVDSLLDGLEVIRNVDDSVNVTPPHFIRIIFRDAERLPAFSRAM